MLPFVVRRRAEYDELCLLASYSRILARSRAIISTRSSRYNCTILITMESQQEEEPSNKKPKLEASKDTTGDPSVVELIADGASSSSSAPSEDEGDQAVTALAVLDDDQTLFSGHRNGLIQRWDLGGGASSGSSTNRAAAALEHSVVHRSDPARNVRPV